MTEKTCMWCGNTFVATRSSKMYCSEGCLQAAMNDRKMKKYYADRNITLPSGEDHLSQTLKSIDGDYAEHQKKQTVEMYARINVDDVLRRINGERK